MVNGLKTPESSSVETTQEIFSNHDIFVAIRAKSVFIRASSIPISALTFHKYKTELLKINVSL